MDSTPKWLRPVAIAAVLWNLLGCLAFAADLALTPDDIARMPAAQQQMYAARPSWSVIATGVATVGGLLGSIALLTRRRIAVPLLVASVLGIVAQDAGLLRASGGMPGTVPMLLQSLVLVIGVALAWLAWRWCRPDRA